MVTTPSTPPRRVPAGRSLCAILLAGAALAAGCGGGGAASKDEYAAELNDFCTSFLAATKELQGTGSDISGQSDPKKAAMTLGTAVEKFSGSLEDSLAGLKDTEAPEEYAKFNDGLVTGLDKARVQLDKVAVAAKKGDAKSLGQLGQTLSGLDVPDPPKDLEAKATKCRG